jgi:hypothetical protein
MASYTLPFISSYRQSASRRFALWPQWRVAYILLPAMLSVGCYATGSPHALLFGATSVCWLCYAAFCACRRNK